MLSTSRGYAGYFGVERNVRTPLIDGHGRSRSIALNAMLSEEIRQNIICMVMG